MPHTWAEGRFDHETPQTECACHTQASGDRGCSKPAGGPGVQGLGGSELTPAITAGVGGQSLAVAMHCKPLELC